MKIEIEKEFLIAILAASFIDYGTFLTYHDGKSSFSDWVDDAKNLAKDNLEIGLGEEGTKILYHYLTDENLMASYENNSMSLEDYARLTLKFSPENPIPEIKIVEKTN